MDDNDNNLVKEIYPEQVKFLNPYDISYIAMKNGSIIMIIEPISNNKKEQTSPKFGRKYMSYINEEKNPCLIEKKKYIFYKKANNKEKEKAAKNLIKHSKTFSFSGNTTPIKKKNRDYNNISIKLSRYSSKKNHTNKISVQDTNYSYGFLKSNSEMINLNKNVNDIIYSDDYYDVFKKPKIEYSDDYAMNKYYIDSFNNHTVLSNSILNNQRPKTPILTMRDLGKRNHRKNNGNKNKTLELKKCLSKDNHRYYERKELSAPKKSKSNYIKMKSFEGNTIHVFENN